VSRLESDLRLAGFGAAVVLWLGLSLIPHYADTLAYHRAGLIDPYLIHLKTQAYAYLYSPAFTQAFEPLRVLPEGAVYSLFLAGILGVFAYCVGPWLLLVLAIPWTLGELLYGNIDMFLVAAALVGFRWPAAWAFVLLTKVTPGIGLLWFAFGREWRALAIAAGTTVSVAAVSFILAPQLWFDSIDVLRDNVALTVPAFNFPVPLWARLALAVALLAWAAPRDQRWAVPVALTLGSAWLAWPTLVMLVGILPTARGRLRERASRPGAIHD
jgi:Glycosyltransferase family 87